MPGGVWMQFWVRGSLTVREEEFDYSLLSILPFEIRVGKSLFGVDPVLG
jgi:hypothetical protein